MIAQMLSKKQGIDMNLCNSFVKNKRLNMRKRIELEVLILTKIFECDKVKDTRKCFYIVTRRNHRCKEKIL